MAEKGKIKKYFADRKFGFITRENGEKDAFFRIEDVQIKHRDNLKEGSLVEFEVREEERGVRAKDVSILKSPTLHYQLPRDTQETINVNEIDNFSLKLNKIVYFDGKTFPLEHNKNDFSKVNFESLIKRQENYIHQLGLKTKRISFDLDWRMVIGLGQESIYETSMTLHHLYGFPYIPGQAIKGLLRNYIIHKYFTLQETGDETQQAEKIALKDEGFIKLFGEEGQKGNVIFFDGFPKKAPKIKLDVVTPHFSTYYQNDSQPPTDKDSPRIIKFLTVEDTSFDIFIGMKEKNDFSVKKTILNVMNPLDFIEEELLEAFMLQGIGAKTASGYGYGIWMEKGES